MTATRLPRTSVAPRTAAGRALLADLWGAYAPRVHTADGGRDRILAIEAEATIEADALLAALVEAIQDEYESDDEEEPHQRSLARIAAARAYLNRRGGA